MGKTKNNIVQICTKEEFDQFKSFHELFKELMREHDLSSEKFDQLFEYVNDFESQIVPIAKKVGVDLSKHAGAIVEIWEQLGSLPDPYDTKGISFSGDEYGEAASNYLYEQEYRLHACKDAIADLDKVMVALYDSQPKNSEPIEKMAKVFEAFLEHRKDSLEVGRSTETERKVTSQLKNIIGWIFKKTWHLICAIIIAVVAAIIAAIIVDIFADLGWIEWIKTIFHNILTPK